MLYLSASLFTPKVGVIEDWQTTGEVQIFHTFQPYHATTAGYPKFSPMTAIPRTQAAICSICWTTPPLPLTHVLTSTRSTSNARCYGMSLATVRSSTTSQTAQRCTRIARIRKRPSMYLRTSTGFSTTRSPSSWVVPPAQKWQARLP